MDSTTNIEKVNSVIFKCISAPKLRLARAPVSQPAGQFSVTTAPVVSEAPSVIADSTEKVQ